VSKFIKNPQFPDATKEQIMEQLRLWRNRELLETDWKMISDVPSDKIAWAEYRQTLRDLPTQSDDAEEIIIPERPT
jgi:hypothetical protein